MDTQVSPVETILAGIEASADLYHRLILVAGLSGAGKTVTLRAVAAHGRAGGQSHNLELSRRLLDLAQSRRALEVPGALDEILRRDRPLVLLDNTEILFDPAPPAGSPPSAAARIAQPDDRCVLERHGRRSLPELRGSWPS